MRLKRLISCLLSAALLAGLLVFPPASASGSGGFSDISDSTVADAAEMLRLLGVVDGTGGGAFNPGGTLSRGRVLQNDRGDHGPRALRSPPSATAPSSPMWAPPTGPGAT